MNKNVTYGGHSIVQKDLTRFNKICHPSQRPRWQVDKEAIGLSRVQHCLLEVQHCLLEVRPCLLKAQHCLLEVQHCLPEVRPCLLEVQHCLLEVRHCLLEVQHCLLEVRSCLVRFVYSLHVYKNSCFSFMLHASCCS